MEKAKKKAYKVPEELREFKLQELKDVAVGNLESYYKMWRRPVLYGHFFGRLNGRIYALSMTQDALAVTMQEENLLKVMDSPRNRRFIFPQSAIDALYAERGHDEGETEILHQLMIAENNT